MSSAVNRRADHHSDVVSSSVAAAPRKVTLRQVEEAPAAKFITSGPNYRQVPIGVVIPRDAADVVETVALIHL